MPLALDESKIAGGNPDWPLLHWLELGLVNVLEDPWFPLIFMPLRDLAWLLARSSTDVVPDTFSSSRLFNLKHVHFCDHLCKCKTNLK